MSGEFHLDAALFNLVGHFRRKGLISDEHGNLGGRNGIECRVVCYAGGGHGDDYLGIRGDDALDEFGLQHVLVSGAMLGGVAVWRQHDHVNAQGPGGLGGVLPYIDQGFAVEVSARAIEAQVRNAFKPGQQRGVVGNHMRIFGIDVVAYLVAHGAAVNEHNHGSGNILNGFFAILIDTSS